MFDYSQHGFPSRLACEGELLVTHRFPTQWIGLASGLDMEKTEYRRAQADRRANCFAALQAVVRGDAGDAADTGGLRSSGDAAANDTHSG